MTPQDPAVTLSIRMFGRFEVLRGENPIPSSAWGRRKTLTLLKILLTQPGQSYSQDQLIELLYGGENPGAKAHNLRGRISELRHALEPEMEHRGTSKYITRSGDGYRFEPQGCWIDTEVFRERLAYAAKAESEGQWSLAAEAYDIAVELARGEFLAEDRYAEWAFDRRDQLRDDYVRALSNLARCHAELHRFARAIECCDRALHVDPTSETIARQLMEYSYHAGDQGKALSAYRDVVTALERDLGVSVSEETEALRDRIVQGTLSSPGQDLDPLRLAVLPLVTIGSATRTAYFAEGMTEELIYRLSRLSQLRVIAQTSVLPYRDTCKPIVQIGRELRVGTILEGSVRKSGTSLRVTVQLIDVASEAHLWSAAYDEMLDNVFAVQTQIADKVVDALRVELLDEESRQLAVARTENPEAYDLYLRGRHQMAMETADGYRKAISYFERAIELDPTFAFAYGELSAVHCHRAVAPQNFWEDGFRQAQGYAERALQLQPNLSSAHTSMGYVHWVLSRDPDKADFHFRKALESAPCDVHACRAYANFLANWGRGSEAHEFMQQMYELNPLSPSVNIGIGRGYLAKSNFEEALRCFRRALEIDPHYPWALTAIAETKEYAGDWIGAGETFRRLIEQDPEDPRFRDWYAHHLLFRGRVAEALREIDVACDLAGHPPQFLWIRGEILMIGRRYDEAKTVLAEVIAEEPHLVQAHMLLGLIHGLEGDTQEALDRFDQLTGFVPLSSWSYTWVTAWKAVVHAWAGHTAEARKLLDRLLTRPEHRHGWEHFVASVYFALGDLDLGFEWLERSLSEYSILYLRIAITPVFIKVRDDPRFQEILTRRGFITESA